MKKNIKRYLSYVLGVILAMGLGLSYAYAVGANDSNAFVTTTEWETKVAQIEASLDNVTKTINDTNMDFVMSGPRLQTTMVDGAENCVSVTSTDFGYLYTYGQHSNSTANDMNRYNYWIDYYLQDLWNGRQSLAKINWPTSDTDYNTLCIKFRYALATTIPGWYIIVSHYGGSSWIFHYAKVGKYPLESTISQKAFEVKFKKDEWGYSTYNAGTTIGALSRTNTSIYMGNVSYPEYIRAANSANLDGFTNNTGYLTRTVDGDYLVQKFEFTGQYFAMKSSSQAQTHFPFYPLKMENRKFGTHGDTILYSPTMTGEVARVYSPQKGCYCLKSYINGEIPILNE